jgi:hypothetical protein
LTARELISKLKGVKKSGSGWIARCPAHDDKHASLSISEGDDEKVLTHCHAGCSPEQVWATLPVGSPARREVATYDYRDETGVVCYQSVRFEKDFRQRRPDGNGGWIWEP